MATVSEIQTRVLNALELSNAEPAASDVSGWVSRAVASLSYLFETRPVFSVSLIRLRSSVEKIVDDNLQIEEPSGCVRLLAAGTINGCWIKRIVRQGEPLELDEHRKATVFQPWLRAVTVTETSARDPVVKYEVLPRHGDFANTIAKLYYLKEPAATDEIGEEIADCITYRAAMIGATDNGDNVKLGIMEKRWQEEMARLGAR